MIRSGGAGPQLLLAQNPAPPSSAIRCRMSTAPARSPRPQSQPAQTTRKRRASSAFTDCPDEVTRKRMRDINIDPDVHPPDPNLGLADDVAQELQCACCSELVYRPVLVIPCQHFFCGRCVCVPHLAVCPADYVPFFPLLVRCSCCLLWIRVSRILIAYRTAAGVYGAAADALCRCRTGARAARRAAAPLLSQCLSARCSRSSTPSCVGHRSGPARCASASRRTKCIRPARLSG